MRNGILAGRVSLPLAMFAIGLLVAAVLDLRARRIPNAVVFPLLVLGVTYNTALGGTGGAGRALIGALLGIAMLFVPFAARLIGGGDVKLLGAIGAWLGPASMLWVALWAAVLSGALVALLLLRHRVLRRDVAINMTTALLTREVPAVAPRPRAHTVPIGAALAAAALWVAIGEGAFPHG